ncbi:hypothetical protein DSO57_1016082 [Entomophthora muscae]|uniref:Uncharacterized protein n=1 Tax=Entomophthora muscae TaxID=34485 RepID=A0ACC2S6T2_9FUNG|nr:hypothetical protein DSO57_1016082 [Entomophthora muscae]
MWLRASSSSHLPSLRRLSGQTTLRCIHISSQKSAWKEDTELPVQLLAPRMANPAEATSKEEPVKGELRWVLVPFVPPPSIQNATHVAKQLYLSPCVVIHMCALQARVDKASNKDNMLKSDNVWLAGDTVN